MLESLLVYSILFIIMCMCGVISARKEKKYVGRSGVFVEEKRFFTPEVIIIVLSFSIVFGFRWGVGVDYFRYLYAYTEVIPERFEFLFQLVSSILKRLGAHYSIYFGIWAFLDIVLLYYALHKYRFIYPYIAFFLIFGSYYLPMMNGIRQHIATMIFLTSIRYVDQKQIVKFYLCLTVAFLFHKLSAILFLIYPLLRLKDDWFNSIVLQIVLYILALYLSVNGELVLQWIETPFDWLTEVLGYDRYDYDFLDEERFDRSRFGNNTGFGLIVSVIRTLPVILFSKNLKEYYNSSHFNMLYSLYFLGVVSSLLFGNSIVLNRIAYFFSIYQLIIHCFFVYYCFDEKSYTKLILGIMMMMIHIPLFLNIISNSSSTAQYLFFWQQSSSLL